MSVTASGAELVALRKLTSKTHDNGDGAKTLEAHVGHIHYENKLLLGDGVGGLRSLDWTLGWDNSRRGWGFQFHSFHPFLPEYADEWVSFRDLFEGKDQTVRYKAVCSHVKGRLVPSIDGLTDVNAVIYDDAFGTGKDYVLIPTRSALVKVVRIREGTKVEEDQQFAFGVEFPHKVKRTDGETEYILDLTSDKTFDTDKETLTGIDQDDGREWFTYLRPFRMWDSEHSERAPVEYKTDGVTGWLVKTVPLSFIEAATGDVFTDTTTSYYAGTGDGSVRGSGGSWVPTSPLDYQDTDTYDDWFLSQNSGGTYYCRRVFLPFDTSAIPDTDVISGAYLSLYPNTEAAPYEGCLFEGTQASTSSLSTSDYAAFTGSELATRFDEGDITPGNRYNWSLTDLTTINKTGWTKLCVREGRDADASNAPGVGTYYRIQAYYAEDTGTARDPYLSVTYAPGGTAYDASLTAGLTLAAATAKATAAARTVGLTLAASLTTTRGYIRSLTAGLTFAAALAKATSAARTAGITLAATTTKAVARAITAGITLAASVSAKKIQHLAVSAGITLSAALTKATGAARSAGLTLAATTTRTIAAARTAGITLAASLATTRGYIRAFSAGLALAAATAKVTATAKTAGMTLAASIATTRGYTRALTAGMTLAASVTRVTATAKTAGITLAATTARTTGKALTAGLTLTAAVAKTLMRAVTAGLTLAASMAKATSRAVTAGITLAASVTTKKIQHLAVSAGITLAAATTKTTTAVRAAGLTLSASTTRAVSATRAAGFTLAGTTSLATTRALTAGLTLAASVAKATSRTVTAGFTLAASVAKQTGKALSAGITLAASLSTLVTRTVSALTRIRLSGDSTESRSLSGDSTESRSLSGDSTESRSLSGDST